MATHSSILAWEIPRTEQPGGYSPWGHKRAGQDLATKQQKAHLSGLLNHFRGRIRVGIIFDFSFSLSFQI